MAKKISKIYSDLSKKVEKQPDIFQPSRFINTSKEATETKIRLAGLEDYYRMRQRWGNILERCLIIILGFNILLVFFVGLGVLNYKDDWFLRIVLTTNLADIIGLVYVVVNFLFSNQPNTNNKSNKKEKSAK